MNAQLPQQRWEHFPHQADVGIRGFGATKAEAFAQAAIALTAIITAADTVTPRDSAPVSVSAPEDELLFLDWLNAIVFEMATRTMLFSRFDVQIEAGDLHGTLWGEPVDVDRHMPAVEVKGATFTELRVAPTEDGGWLAQCVLDV